MTLARSSGSRRCSLRTVLGWERAATDSGLPGPGRGTFCAPKTIFPKVLQKCPKNCQKTTFPKSAPPNKLGNGSNKL